MSTAEEKRTVEQIVEDHFDSSSIEGIALMIHELQVNATNFVDSFGTYDGDVDWKTIGYYEIPREFIEMCQRLAAYEIKL